MKTEMLRGLFVLSGLDLIDFSEGETESSWLNVSEIVGGIGEIVVGVVGSIVD